MFWHLLLNIQIKPHNCNFQNNNLSLIYVLYEFCLFVCFCSLLRNPVTAKKHYRLYVIHKCPFLRVLDFQRIKQKVCIWLNNGKMCYLITHSTHCIYCCMASDMVTDHSENELGNVLASLHGILFPINSRDFKYALSHRQYSIYHSLWYTCCGVLAGLRSSSIGPSDVIN